MKLPILIEKTGGIVVAEEFCSTSRLLHDTVAVDEWFLYDMIPAVADRYLKPCTCPNFTPNTDRNRKLLDMINDFSIDGVIYQSFAGCQLYELESRQVGNVVEQSGTPMLYLETDYNSKDDGQLSTRVEAFIESLKTKKSTISMRA
jgi:benzoyl-CoA reductase/2-hydroxyglutaryl-CoA dehydratase subunit BcrC/BadD/HgdB